jgi:hypothetical protein
MLVVTRVAVASWLWPTERSRRVRGDNLSDRRNQVLLLTISTGTLPELCLMTGHVAGAWHVGEHDRGGDRR